MSYQNLINGDRFSKPSQKLKVDSLFAKTIGGDNIVFNNILQDNTQNKLLVLDSVSNQVEFRDVSSLPGGGGGGNPFDQDLNTFDNPQFNSLTSSTNMVTNNITLNQISAAGVEIDMNNNVQLNNNNISGVDNVSSNTMETSRISLDEIEALGSEVNFLSSVGVVGTGNILHITDGNDLVLTDRVPEPTSTKICVLDGTDNVTYKDESDLVVFNDYEQRIFLAANYTTSSLIFTNSGGPATYPSMSSGKYMVMWSCKLSNTDLNSTTTARMIIEPDGNPDLVVSEISTPTFKVLGQFSSMSGFYVYDNVLNVDTDFRLQFRTSGFTGILNNYSVVVYKFNV